MTDSRPIPADLFLRAAAFGADVPHVLKRAGLDPSQAGFSTAEEMAFWRALEELTPDRSIGLRLGSEKTPEQLNFAELAAIHAPTLDEALPRIARYKRLVCAEEVTIERRKDEVSIGFHWIRAKGATPHLLLECVFAAVVSLALRASGERLVPRRVELSRRRADAPLLKGHFGCPIVFDAPHDRLVLAASDLKRRFELPDADRYARLLPSLEAKVDSRSLTFVDEVRSVMRRAMVGEQVTIARIARGLGLTPRTLQRRLVKEGTSYQVLLDDVRRGTARRLLDATNLQEGEIAFFLGFAELNSFTRAFRAWEGTTPRHWRSLRETRKTKLTLASR